MSAVWKYFTKCSDSTLTECNACKRIVARNGGCTTNMWKHLERCAESVSLLPKEILIKRNISGTIKSTTPLTKSTSPDSDLWKYFTISSKDSGYLTCKNCKEDIKKVKGNTANLWRHRQACMQLIQLTESSDALNFDVSTDELSVNSSTDDNLNRELVVKETIDLSQDSPPSRNLESQQNQQPKVSSRLEDDRKLRKTRSQVWQYFELTDNQCAVCKRCNAKLNRFDGSTSNLWSHANRCFGLGPGKKKKYPTASATASFAFANEVINDDDIQNFFGSFDGDDIANAPASPSDILPFSNNRLNLVLQRNPIFDDHLPFDKMTKKLSSFLIKDLPSYDILEGSGFKEFVTAVAPKHGFRSTQEMHNDIISVIKLKATNMLKRCLRESVSPISLVVDSWTVNHTSFIALHAYFIDPKHSPLSPSCITLACRTFPVSQLKETYFIMDTVNRWLRNDAGDESMESSSSTSIDDLENSSLLPYRSISFIKTPISIPMGIFKDYTDAESMGTLECVNTKVNQCFKEATFNCMQGTEPNILKLIDSLLKFLQSDPSALSRLRTIQKGLGSTKFLFLPSDFKNGLQEAIESLQLLLELKNALLILFETSGTSDNFPVLLQSDWSALSLTTNFVTAIEEIICTCKNTSISFFLPAFFKLQTMSKDYTDKNCRSDSWVMVRPLVSTFEQSVEEVLAKYCSDERYISATFLDPGLKRYLSPALTVKASEEFSGLSANTTLPSISTVDCFSQGISQNSNLNPIVVKTELVSNDWLQSYISTSFPEDTNPVLYWLNQSDTVPKITEQALRYLAVPACNKSCRDIISKSAAFNSLQNASTNSEALDNLFFLNLNFSTCTFIQELLN